MPHDPNSLSLESFFEQIVGAEHLASVIAAARAEDLGGGDLSSAVLIEPSRQATAQIRSRAAGHLAGGVALAPVALAYDQSLEVVVSCPDGQALEADDVIATVSGPLRSLLGAERVMLNFLTHLSGIATLTGAFVDAVSGTKARVFDTRKTIPGLRALAKYAVRCGGGYSHRMGLHDAVLIKDNHLAHLDRAQWPEKLTEAIAAARARNTPDFVEIEVDDLDQLRLALDLDVDMVLLDNMTGEQLTEAVALRDGAGKSVLLEASGGITLDSARAVASSGVDRIAVGALTHSAPALDIGMDIES